MFSAYREAGNTRLFWSALLGMLGMWIEGLSYFGIYRLMAQASPKHAHQYRTGIIGYIVLGILYHSGMGADIRICQRNDTISEMVLDFLSADWNDDCENAQHLWQSCLGQCH